MTVLRAAYVLGAGAYGLIYGPEQRDAVRRLVAGDPPVLTGEEAARTSLLEDVDVILSGWGAPVMDRAFLDQAPRLRAVLYGAGAVSGFVTDDLVARGVAVSSAASGNAVPVAEYTVAAVHFSLKRVWQLLRAPDDDARAAVLPEIGGAYDVVVGLVGLGEIGRLVALRLASDGIRLLAHDPYLAPADAHDLTVAEELLEGAQGWALGDRNYWSPKLTERLLGEEGLRFLLAPYKSKKREKEPWPRWLVQKRRRIETVIGQLVERYRAKKVRARATAGT